MCPPRPDANPPGDGVPPPSRGRFLPAPEPRGPWSVEYDPQPSLLHFALWVRDAAGIEVPASRLNPAPLEVRPEPVDAALDGSDWLRWWHALLHRDPASPFGHDPFFAAPPGVREVVEPLARVGAPWVDTHLVSGRSLPIGHRDGTRPDFSRYVQRFGYSPNLSIFVLQVDEDAIRKAPGVALVPLRLVKGGDEGWIGGAMAPPPWGEDA